jgi:lipopolysaccharide export system protein LptA
MLRPLALSLALLLPGIACAQTNLSLGSIGITADTPIEVSADRLSVDQATGRAVWSGNVLVVQDEVRIGAEQVEVFSDSEGRGISRLVATGGVTFVTSAEAAEATSADYDLSNGVLVLTGEVLLTQGSNVLSAERMTVNMSEGTAQLDGRVRTVFKPEGQ